MKKILPIGLLILLLYNTFGLSFAILFFEKGYQSASAITLDDDWKVIKIYLPSLPYSGNLEISKNMEGLIRQDDDFYNPTQVFHENDTLYVTLKSNQAARDRFFELANAMQAVDPTEADKPLSPYGQLVKQLTNLVKDYVPQYVGFKFHPEAFSTGQITAAVLSSEVKYLSFKSILASPPPELS